MAQTGQPSETERKLETENAELKKRNAELVEQNCKLQKALNDALTALACARKTSGTSSKPPSSDIVKVIPGTPYLIMSGRGQTTHLSIR